MYIILTLPKGLRAWDTHKTSYNGMKFPLLPTLGVVLFPIIHTYRELTFLHDKIKQSLTKNEMYL